MREKSYWSHPFLPDSCYYNLALLIEVCKLAFIVKVIYTFNRKKINYQEIYTQIMQLTIHQLQCELASCWSINDFRAISKNHLPFPYISITVLKLASTAWFQMADIMFPAKIKISVSHSVTVKALLYYCHMINQECLCYLWEVLPTWYFPTTSFLSFLLSAYYFFLTVVAKRTIK